MSKTGLSLIERGVRETSVQTLFALARSLEVPPELLLEGIAWKPERPPCQGSRARRPGRSLDDAIRRLWKEDKTAREIAEAVGTSPGTVSATVHRLRERGEPLRHRRPPTRAVHERARRRRAFCQAPRFEEDQAVGEAIEPAGLDSASNEEIAMQIGANVAFRREEAGLSLRQLSEAAETHFTHLSRIERGKSGVPQLALILKLAGSLNVRCGLITAGVAWDSASGSFRVHMRTDLVLDALRMALGLRSPGANVALVHHSDRGSQYTSAEFTQALDDHDVLGSLGSTGDAYDNALAESFVDSFKTELIADRTWRSVEQAELAIVEWVSWFNHDRLHSSIGDIPPVEFEQLYWERVEDDPPPGSTRPTGSLRRAAGEHPEPLPSSVKLQATEAT